MQGFLCLLTLFFCLHCLTQIRILPHVVSLQRLGVDVLGSVIADAGWFVQHNRPDSLDMKLCSAFSTGGLIDGITVLSFLSVITTVHGASIL